MDSPTPPSPTPAPTPEIIKESEASPGIFGEVARSEMSKSIILMEQAAFKLAGVQRMQELQKAPLHVKVARIMEELNYELSVPEEKRDHALSIQTQGMLKNMRIKSNLSMFLALQAQIQRLSNITLMAGIVDQKLAAKETIESMDVDQLILLQRSLHRQAAEISNFIDGFRMENLEGVLNTLFAQDVADEKEQKEVSNLLTEISDLKTGEREKVSALIKTLLTVAKRKHKAKPVTDIDAADSRSDIPEA